jgi:uncharacterized protein YbaP (TraB family)
MKKILYLIFISLVVCSCERSGSSKLNYKSIKLENSLLWQISGNGLKSPSYLFGTEHLVGASFLDSLPYVVEKLKLCGAVAGEVIIDSISQKANPNWFLQNDSLSREFNSSEFSAIDDVVRKYTKRPLKNLNRVKPIFIELLLVNTMSPHTASDNNPALDKYFQQEARKNNMKVIGLETWKFEDSLIFNMPLSIQKKELLYLVSDRDHVQKSFKDFYTFYKRQDVNAIEKLTLSFDETPQEEMDKITKNRNESWLKALPGIMNQQPTFIAVGAAHLLWDCGLINQLRLKGYVVTPITN